jgi:hypothetical protein
MNFELFDRHQRQPHQDPDYGDIPPGRERTGEFWQWVGNWIGLPAPASSLVDKNGGARPFIGLLGGHTGLMDNDLRWEAMRRREARIAELNNAVPYRPSLGEVVSEVATAVVEALKSSKLTEARLFVGEKLRAGPMKAAKLEKLAKSAGIAPRTLRRALKSLKVHNRRNSDKTTTLSLIQAEPEAGQK